MPIEYELTNNSESIGDDKLQSMKLDVRTVKAKDTGRKYADIEDLIIAMLKAQQHKSIIDFLEKLKG